MEDIKGLKKYFSALTGKENARYLLCEKLGEKRARAEDILRSCILCERRCRVDRAQGQKGYCRVLETHIASEFLHMGEEPPLIPSYTIFFAGCTFKCVYCQNWDISQFPQRGAYVEPKTLAGMIEASRGVNVNWVGGDPTPNIPYILRVLEHLKRNIPQIWNSNMYLTEEAMELLDGVIDVYLTDFKYGSDECAKRLSDAKNYLAVVQRNHLLAKKQGEVIIRHLVLPGHLECCTKPVLEWISESMRDVSVNVMAQYHPEYRAREYDELAEGLTHQEFNEAIEYAKGLGLNLIF